MGDQSASPLKSPECKRPCLDSPVIMDLSKCLKITNLPHPLMEMTFKSFMEKLRISKDIAPELKRAIVRMMYFSKENYAYIEFPYAQIVTEMVKLEKATFLKSIIEFEHAIYEDATMMESDMTVSNLTLGFGSVFASTPTKKKVTEAASLLVPITQTASTGTTCNQSVTDMMKGLSPFKPKSQLSDEIIDLCSGQSTPSTPIKSQVTETASVLVPITHTASTGNTCNQSFTDMMKGFSPLKPKADEVLGACCGPSTPNSQCMVKVTGLPLDCDVDLLQFQLNREVIKAFSLEKKAECVALSCRNDVDKSFVFELVSEEWAHHLCAIKSVTSDGREAHIEPYTTAENSSKVKVTGLKAAFDMDLLEYVLNREVINAFGLPKKAECVVSSSLDGHNTAVFEFIQIDWAQHLCGMGSIQFDGNRVTLSGTRDDKKKPESDLKNDVSVASTSVEASHTLMDLEGGGGFEGEYEEEEEDDNMIRLKDSCFIKVSGFPTPVDKVDLQNFLIQKMEEANFILEGGDQCIQECIYHEENSSCILKFSTCEEANLATLLGLVKYRTCTLKIVKVCPDLQTSNLESAPLNEYFHLDSENGKLTFMKFLIMYRDHFPKTGSHDTILDGLRKRLLKKNVLATVAQLRAFRQNLLKQHRNRKRANNTVHPLHVPCSVIFDGSDKNLLDGTEYELGEEEEEEDTQGNDFNSALMKFSTIAAWSTAASTALVGILIDKQEDYWKPMRKSTFWKEVSLRMLADNYPYNESQCENHLDRNLKPAFKDYVDLNSSGKPAIWRLIPDQGTLKLMQLMQTFMGHCVSVQPQKTFAVGYKAQERQPSIVFPSCSSEAGSAGSEHNDNSVNLKRVGRERPTVLKRKVPVNPNLSLKERKQRTEEMKAKALMMLAKSRMKTKYVVTEDDEEYDEDEL